MLSTQLPVFSQPLDDLPCPRAWHGAREMPVEHGWRGPAPQEQEETLELVPLHTGPEGPENRGLQRGPHRMASIHWSRSSALEAEMR